MAAETSLFIYDELPHGHCRILEITAGNPEDDLYGRLCSVPLAEVGMYIALSYTWGPPQFNESLFLPQRKAITKTLASALVRLRSRIRTVGVWADAVCINQEDLDEKNVQIPLMQQIYENATVVVIDLGDEDAESELLGSLFLRCPDFDNRTGLGKIKADPSMLNKAQALDMPDISSKTGSALEHLLERPWFRRCWIFQEAVVAKRLEVACGGWKVGWGSFKFALMMVGVTSSPDADLARIDAGRANARVSLINRMRSDIIRGTPLNLPALMFHNRNSEATESADYMYGILGLSGLHREHQLRVDYEEPYLDTFLRYSRFLVDKGLGLKLLYLIEPSLQNPKLPSWVPDFSLKGVENNHYKAELFDRTGSLFNTATSQEPYIQLDSDGRSIKLSGAVFGSIERIGHDLIAAQQILQKRDTHVFLSVFPQLNQTIASFGALQGVQDPPAIASQSTLDASNVIGSGKQAETSQKSGHVLMSTSLSNALVTESQPQEASDIPEDIRSIVQSMLICKVSGLTGEVPAGTEKGDVIVLVFGSQIPFVFRPVDEGWRLIGSAYIDGIMQGEALLNSDHITREFLVF